MRIKLEQTHQFMEIESRHDVSKRKKALSAVTIKDHSSLKSHSSNCNLVIQYDEEITIRSLIKKLIKHDP